jgi:hypothetical protein
MHLRYDLKNKLDLSNFEKQATFFISKESCDFSFYFADFSVYFETFAQDEKINLSVKIAETKPENIKYQYIDPKLDPRLSGLSFVDEIFNSGHVGHCVISSIKETIEYIVYVVKIMSKINKLVMIS